MAIKAVIHLQKSDVHQELRQASVTRRVSRTADVHQILLTSVLYVPVPNARSKIHCFFHELSWRRNYTYWNLEIWHRIKRGIRFWHRLARIRCGATLISCQLAKLGIAKIRSLSNTIIPYWHLWGPSSSKTPFKQISTNGTQKEISSNLFQWRFQYFLIRQSINPGLSLNYQFCFVFLYKDLYPFIPYVYHCKFGCFPRWKCGTKD